MRGKRGAVAANQARARHREGEAFRLRLQGDSFQAIGRELGMTEAGACRAYYRALRRHPSADEAEKGRALEAARLDALQVPFWAKALHGDLQAVDRVLKIIRKRCELLGLDAPADVNLVAVLRVIHELRSLPEPDLLEVLGYSVEDDGNSPHEE